MAGTKAGTGKMTILAGNQLFRRLFMDVVKVTYLGVEFHVHKSLEGLNLNEVHTDDLPDLIEIMPHPIAYMCPLGRPTVPVDYMGSGGPANFANP